MEKPLVLRDNKTFRSYYHSLKKGDAVVGLLNLKPTEEFLFLDLAERGIRLFPSALSQKLSRSKCLQALVYERWMVPGTTVIRDRHDMVVALNTFGGESPIITKQDRLNCGLGINIWPDIETIYNQTRFGGMDYPFVVQPFVEDALDIRVIILGAYKEAYWRKNSKIFRNNLYFGGETGPYELKAHEMALIQNVMERGRFPYAHIDLLVDQKGENTYLSEINLRGGLKGARISTSKYKALIAEMEDAFVKGG